MARKPNTVVQFKLRIRENLRRQIEKAAKAHEASINTEMANRLEASFRQEAPDWLTEGKAMAAQIKEAFGNFDPDVWRETRNELDLALAATELVSQFSNLPMELQNQPEMKAAVARVLKAIRASNRAIALTGGHPVESPEQVSERAREQARRHVEENHDQLIREGKL
ncbi:MAG TPA: Arc family DNA-binding protein [Bradyrhizobium sp.]|nr:Arc family DNA-binding protein [Bradyrhizobium sp.]